MLNVAVDDGRVLAVSDDGQRCLFEDLHQCLLPVDEHVARAAAHEELDAGQAVRVELGKQVGIVVGGSEEERVVDVALLPGQAELLVERLQGGHLRDGVGHVEERRHAPIGCRAALALDVGLGGESRFAEVHMCVDDTG